MNKQVLMMTAAIVIAAATVFSGCKKEKETVKVTGVSVSPASVTLAIGDNTHLTATIVPANADDHSVVWTSDKPSVATVNENGVVTAVAAGEAIITCKTNDGELTATTTIIVKHEPNYDDYATLVQGSYVGDITLGTEPVGENKLITVKYKDINKVEFVVDETFTVPQMENAEIPLKVNCITDVTKSEDGYNSIGETTVTILTLTLPVSINANFSITNGKTLDMTINVSQVPSMGNIVLNFKGTEKPKN